MFVSNWMNSDPLVVAPDQTLAEAWQMMEELNIRRLPVMRDGKMVGIVTKTDLSTAFGRPVAGEAYTPGENKNIEDVMTREVKTLFPGSTIEEAALIMHDFKISGVPVLDDKTSTLVGIITETDVFQAFIEIMGLQEHSPRISFEHSEETGLIDAIRERVPEGGSPRSVVCWHDQVNGRWQVVLRIKGNS